MKKRIFKQLLMGLSIGSLVLAGCVDEYTYDPEKDPTYVGSAPSELDFSTTQNVQLHFNYTAMDGFTSVYDVYTEYPLDEQGSLRKDLTPIAGGIHVTGQADPNRVIPSYVNELYVYSPSLFVPLVSYAKVANGVADFEIAEIKTSQVRTRDNQDDLPVIGGDFNGVVPSKYLKDKEDYYQETAGGNLKFDLINPDYQKNMSPVIATAIGAAFPEREIVDPEYYQDATIVIENGKEDGTGAEVFVSILHSGASFSNSLSYLVYDKDDDLAGFTKGDAMKSATINIFQYADVYGNPVQHVTKRYRGLSPGKYVQLLYPLGNGEYSKEFPVGAKIVWKLHPNGFSEDERFMVYNRMRGLFSYPDWNLENNRTIDSKEQGEGTNNYTIFFSAKDEEGYVYNCFGFEDAPGAWWLNGGADGDCNDVIFHVMTNPENAITPPPTIPTEEIEKTEEKKGILAFEDNWPEQGDYDMNDVVVKYASTITYVKKQEENAPVTVKRVVDKFSLIHTGAAFHNAFSYKVHLNPSVIESIKITNERTQAVYDYTTEIDKERDGFIIDLCADVAAVITPMEFGTEPQNYTVVMTFKEGAVNEKDFVDVSAPYNPFISPVEHKGVEVHLSNCPPTGRADMDLFGTVDDRSDKKDLWYVSGENNMFPFAIHLADADDDFTVPAEYDKIYVTYPKYMDWVNSGMTDHKDWYKK